MKLQSVDRTSVVRAPVESVWARIITPEGINDEMRPWMTMSAPDGVESLTIDTLELGKPSAKPGCASLACFRSTTTSS